jgi:hypothetical protein
LPEVSLAHLRSNILHTFHSYDWIHFEGGIWVDYFFTLQQLPNIPLVLYFVSKSSSYLSKMTYPSAKVLSGVKAQQRQDTMIGWMIATEYIIRVFSNVKVKPVCN